MNKTMEKFGYFILLAALIGSFTWALSIQSRVEASADNRSDYSLANTSEPDLDEFTEELISELKQGGFQVREGYPILVSKDPAETCKNYTYPALNSCLGLNPAAPYVITVMKSWFNEYVDPITVNAFGPVDPGYSPIYRLEPRDAVVVYGRMPPPGKYMGLQTWEWSQHGRWKAKDYNEWATTPNQPFPMSLLFSTMPPNDPKSGRVFTFSALGDIVNNVVMERQSGYPFGEIRYFITTPSAATDSAVRKALQAMGVDNSHIFTEQIPSRDEFGPIGPLGMGKNAIDFTTWFRYAIPDPDYQDAAELWRSQLRKNLKVLRVRPPSSLGPVKRYGLLTFEPRTAYSEEDLAGDMQNLIDEVCDRANSTYGLQSSDCTYPPPASSFMVDPVLDYGWTGPYCREFNMNCDGDQNDAAYPLTKPLPLDSGQVYAVVSTLATETGNATYVGLSVLDASTGYAPVNLRDTMLKGSADSYKNTVDNTGLFFVHFFSRNCEAIQDLTDDQCTTITTDMVPQQGSAEQGDPALQGMFQIVLRNYIAQGTQRGPDASKLLKPRVLMFTQP